MPQPLAQYLHNIPVSPETESVLMRLGGRKRQSLDADFRSMLEEGIRRGKVLCRPDGAYLFLKISDRTPGGITLENGITFPSKSLAQLTKDSETAVFMAATVGKEIVDIIRDEVNQGDAARGVILDAVASQTADGILDWIMKFLNGILSKEGRMLTRRRYSPGYGDLPLFYQQPVFEALGLRKLGLELTEKYMLTPEKSVIAIAGIETKEI